MVRNIDDCESNVKEGYYLCPEDYPEDDNPASEDNGEDGEGWDDISNDSK